MVSRISALLLLSCLTASWLRGQDLASQYKQVLRPVVSQVGVVENADVAWVDLHFHLVSGKLYLAAAPGGPVSAAIFVGDGQFNLAPTSAIEQQQLQLFRHSAQLHEEFSAAVLRFADADAFARALGNAVHFAPATADNGDAHDLIDKLASTDEEMGRDDGARLMLGLSAGKSDALLQAHLRLRSGQWIEADYDPLRQEAIRVHNWTESALAQGSEFDDTWTEYAPTGVFTPAPWHLDHYDLAVHIPGNLDLSAQARFEVQPASWSGSGLLFEFLPNLRVTVATLADGTPIGWLQPRNPGSDPPDGFGNWLYLQLPHPLAGQPVTVNLTYAGKNVITRVGPGNFFCKDEGWYPAPFGGFGPPVQRSSYHMTFTVKKGLTAVVTGHRDSQSTEGDETTSRWSTPVPLTFAGFALGDYSEIDNTVQQRGGGPLQVQVFTNRQPDDEMAYFNLMQNVNGSSIAIGELNTQELAPRIRQEISNAVAYMAALYGPLPYDKLSVTNIPGHYGQGWPTLLYLSSLSYLDSTQLDGLGIRGAAMHELTFSFRAHETSHQWWGHVVGWESPHDQWLSEGFAQASAVLYEQALFGNSAAMDDLKAWVQELTHKDTSNHLPDSMGPLYLGYRLASSLDPNAYQAMVYDKGGYVLLMLRSMMHGNGANADAGFIEMMHDFTHTYAQRDASTADFQAIAEKHMTPAMDLDGNHKLDWFFNEYVYGTGIDTITFRYTMSKAANGGATVNLSVDNPQGWKGLLPIYIYKDSAHVVRGQYAIGLAHQTTSLQVPFVPQKVVANENLDMLVVVEQTSH